MPEGRPPFLTLEERSSLGNHETTLLLDWVSRENKGGDGKVISVQAVALAGVDALASDDAAACVRRDLSARPAMVAPM
jgi:hypothetical protein